MGVIKITLLQDDLGILIPEKLARKYNMFPIDIEEDVIIVGIEKENIYAMQDLKLITGKNVIFKEYPKEVLNEKIKLCYGSFIEVDDNYANNLLQDILDKSIVQNASDIHIEPYGDLLKIRIRVDGKMKELSTISLEFYPSLVSVIKYKASMDITEKRLPQDGRIDLQINEANIDIRISTVPTTYGEKIVLRLLNRNSFLKTKEELGFSKNDVEKIQNIINKKTGILLVTGPTGSGKTTTVYSILEELKNTSKNIMTIEDPIEYKMDGINQIQVNHKVGLTFETGLKAILRQDPDIIMVGEIRDIETAKTAVRAAITGHFVISTLHTNDAISSIARLLDMEVPAYLLNASLIGVISQRLVRKVCNNCSNEIIINENESNMLSTAIPIGCDECNNIGYSGRTVAYEILDINEDIKTVIQHNKTPKEIKDIAIKSGMVTFDHTYSRLINEKVTTLEECIINKEVLS